MDDFGWDKDLTKKIWCFGPDTMGPNLMIDATKAVQYLSEIKDSVVAAFQWASKEGPMSEENMRGSAFEVCHCHSRCSAVHASGVRLLIHCHLLACVHTTAYTRLSTLIPIACVHMEDGSNGVL